MTIHAVPLLAAIPTDWIVGYLIGFVVVVAVVALADPRARLRIGKQAPAINEALEQAVENTAPLGRAAHDHRPRGSHRRRAPPRAYPIGWMIDGNPGAHIEPAPSLVGHAHRRSSWSSFAVVALLSTLDRTCQDHRPSCRPSSRHPESRCRQYREHFAHRRDSRGGGCRAGRRSSAPPVPRSRARKGAHMSESRSSCRSRDSRPHRRLRLLPVLGRLIADENRRQSRRVRGDRTHDQRPRRGDRSGRDAHQPDCRSRGRALSLAVRDGRGHRRRRHAHAGRAGRAPAGAPSLRTAPVPVARCGRVPHRASTRDNQRDTPDTREPGAGGDLERVTPLGRRRCATRSSTHRVLGRW